MQNPGKNQKGMTLVELITGMAILTLLAASLVLVVGPMLGNYSRAKEDADAAILVGGLCDVITNELSYAQGPGTISPDGRAITIRTYGEGVVTLSLKNDVLEKNNAPVFDPGYYKGNTLGGHFSSAGGVISVALSLADGRTGGKELQIFRDFTVLPIEAP